MCFLNIKCWVNFVHRNPANLLQRGRGIALHIKKSVQCEELSLNNNHKQVESLWVRIRDRGNKGTFVVGVYYSVPDQGEHADKAFFLQFQEALRSQALVPLRMKKKEG